MTTINIELSPQGITKALNEIKAYTDSMQNKLDMVAKRLAEDVGIKVVAIHYAKAVGGNNIYDLRVEPFENGCRIVAQGEDVCFMEFGAGVSTESYNGEGQEGLPPIYPGSYSTSEMGKGIFAEKGYWYYDGVKYEGLPATKGLYYASKEMQSKAIEVAKKVFEK